LKKNSWIPQKLFDFSQDSLAKVFTRYYKAMSDASEWMNISLKRESSKYVPRIIVAPTEIKTRYKYKKFKDSDFLAAADNPLWLREPS